MQNPLKQSQAQLQQWRDQAIDAGWLSAHVGAELDQTLHGDPEQLFSGAEQRPLVVAFFGGTGVGKSSLLNRLAGADVARTGVIRPTSREVTVHAHESLSLTQLPEQIPADKVLHSSHSDASSSHVVWIDTPDVDSVATEHREQVLAWLPYVDVVIYVVSPERYKDDAGWQMLREAGDKHAWLFVLNQWDRGQPEQLQDFKRVLAEAGFADPQVFCTICDGSATPDDFDRLREDVEQLSEKNNVSALIAQAEVAQASHLRALVARCTADLGGDDALEQLESEFSPQFEHRSEQIVQDLSWQINASAQRFQQEQGGWRQLLTGKRAAPAAVEVGVATEVWDERANQKVRDALTELVVSAGQRQLPQAPLRAALSSLGDQSPEIVTRRQREALNEALAKPGTLLHRWVFNTVAFFAAVAPIVALGWIAYRVVISFYGGSGVDGKYLGADFAINSLLLLGVAWLLPALLREKIRPSLSSAVKRALRQGLQLGLEDVAAEAKTRTRTYNSERVAVRAQAVELLERLPQGTKAQDTELAALRPVGK